MPFCRNSVPKLISFYANCHSLRLVTKWSCDPSRSDYEIRTFTVSLWNISIMQNALSLNDLTQVTLDLCWTNFHIARGLPIYIEIISVIPITCSSSPPLIDPSEFILI